ncbi:MAG: Phage tail sheath protein [Oscillospiraceae bacterium]|nr:Phage tail sheath protein [Oscillospiraceae bacterium]
MAGGTWKKQNKVRPGVYINVVAEQDTTTTGDRGVLTMPLPLSWGAGEKLIEIGVDDDTFAALGYDMDDILLLREAFKHAETVLLYRVDSGGAQASASVGELTITAVYPGTRGNDITVVISVNTDDEAQYDVATYVDGTEYETQTVTTLDELAANAFVTFSGTGTPLVTAGAVLTGGTDGTATASNYTAYLELAATTTFNVMAIPVIDDTIKALAAAFAEKMREDEGKKIQVVLANYPNADYEGVISVKNGVVLSDGTELTAAQVTAWVGGAAAEAEAWESLTYMEYEDAVSLGTAYSNSQIETALKAGEFLFSESYGRILVEKDINTLVTYGDDKSYTLSKNRVIRALDSYCNDLQKGCALYYIGKIGNDADGRSTLKAYAVKLATAYQDAGAIQNFDAENDIVISAGTDIDAVVMTVALQPVDSIEKIYTTITVGED